MDVGGVEETEHGASIRNRCLSVTEVYEAPPPLVTLWRKFDLPEVIRLYFPMALREKIARLEGN